MSIGAGVSCGDNIRPQQSPDAGSRDAGADAAADAAAVTCPAPAVSEGAGCVLAADVDLATRGTLALDSFTSLDCRGRRIFTSMPGTSITQRSNPEVGVLLRGTQGVVLKNCVVDGFDFSVFAVDSKLPTGAAADPVMLEKLANKLVANTITGRYTAITLVAIDNTRILDSTIKFTTSGGQGILVLRDSDLNQIRNNDISVQLNTDTTGAVKLPGPVLIAGNQTGGTGAIYVSQGTGLPNLLTAVIAGKLHQWSTRATPVADDSFGADNVIEGNRIISTDPLNDISVSVSQRIVLRDNQLGKARIGILFGAATYGVSADFPGTCSGDLTRFCFNGGAANRVCTGDNNISCSVDTDCGASGTCATNECFISGIDQTSKGTCAGKTTQQVYWISDAAIVEGNVLTGPFSTGIQVTGSRVLVQRNDIRGPVAPGTDLTLNGTGIDLRRLAVLSGTVTRNTVSGFPAPLRILNNAPSFGAKISLNDFGAGNAHVFTNSATFAGEISVGRCSGNTTMSCSRVAGGVDDPQTTTVDESTDECASLGFGACENRVGNYWALPCSTLGGFDGSKVIVVGAGSRVDAQGVVTLNGPASSRIVDRNPFGVPVAGLATPPTTLAGGFCSAPP
ncbi:MAG: hypothetical protein H0T46_17235 [Deltaproteobacteria bacterium]|nr:hypothetical protein [Deltaproteobacteria bacterium]